MSVSDTTNRRSYSANGTTTAFSWPAYVEAAADIKLIIVDEDDWSYTVATQGVDYNFTGFGESSGGTISTVGTYASDKTLVAYNEPALIQDFEADVYGAFSTQIPTVETRLDRLTIITQRVLSLANRAVRLGDDNFQGIDLRFPVDANGSAALSGKVPMFDATGTAFASASLWPTGTSFLQVASLAAQAGSSAGSAAISAAAALVSAGQAGTYAAAASVSAGQAGTFATAASAAAASVNLGTQSGVVIATVGSIAAGTLGVNYGGTGVGTVGSNQILIGQGTAGIISIGTLDVARGGIGVGTVGSNHILIGGGTSPISSIGSLDVARGGTGIGTHGSNSLLIGQGTAPIAAIGTLDVARGGTGLGTVGSNSVLIGLGTAPFTSVAPGAAGNALISNGTIWTSSTQSGSGGSGTEASQAEMEAGTGSTMYVSPRRTQYHPGVAKAHVRINAASGTPTVMTSLNVSSITDRGAGLYTVNFAVGFSGTDYVWSSGYRYDNASVFVVGESFTIPMAAGSFSFDIYTAAPIFGNATDLDGIVMTFLGDQ